MYFKASFWLLLFLVFGYTFGFDLFRRHITLHDVNGNTVARNCSCGSCVPTQLEPFCQNPQLCTNQTRTDIANVIQTAESSQTPSWFYLSALTICCNSLSSDSARSLLIDLLDFARISTLELHDCGGLVTSTSTKDITLYSLENLKIFSENKTATLDMRLTDQSNGSDPKLIDIYFIRNVAFLSLNTLDLKSRLKAFSFVAQNEPRALTDSLIKAFNRSPFKNISVPDLDLISPELGNQFMVTPVYV